MCMYICLQIPKPSAALSACEAVHANPKLSLFYYQFKILLLYMFIHRYLWLNPLLDSSNTTSSLDSSLLLCLENMAEENEKGFSWKKRRGKEKIEGEEKGCDPLVVFGSDVMFIILSFLDARSVALSLLVSRAWYGVASTDRLWSVLCEKLWLQKAHIPRISQARGLTKLQAYSLSVMDGKRTRIMKEDLWDHAWEFHYNMVAPEYFRDLDPYWKGTGKLMRRYFHPDGSQTADANDMIWGGHEACYCVVTSFVDDGKIRNHYVRINRWPQLCVTRKEDWSWEMSNHLYSYSSIEDAYKKGGTGPLFPGFRFTA